MYRITKLLNGLFACEGMLQDGTERWMTKTLPDAILSMKQFAQVMNGVVIKRKRITFLQQTHETIITIIPWKPTNHS